MSMELVPKRFTIYRSAKYPWMSATPDYLLGGFPLEVKCRRIQPDEREELGFLVQLHQHMIVLEKDRGIIAVSVAGAEPVWRWETYNERLGNLIIDRTRWAWGFVERGELPPVDGEAATLAAVNGMHEVRELAPLVLPDEFSLYDAALQDAEAMIDEGKALKNQAEAMIKAAMLFHEKAVLPGRAEYRWKKRFIRKEENE